MDSFLGSSDSATVIPKDLGEMPKEQFANADLIADHSRFPADSGKISPKFPAESTDLLGDSFTMSSSAAPDNKELYQQQKENFDDFFMEAVDKKKHEPPASSFNNLIDIGEPDFFGAQKKSAATEPDKQTFAESVAFETDDGPNELVQVKDTIESDYMNPYAEVRSNPAQPKKFEEPSIVPAAAPNDDIFNDFASHSAKKDDFHEPTFDDSPPVTPAVAAIPEIIPAAPVPEPAPVAPAVVPKTVIPAEPPKEQPKPAAAPANVESIDQCIQAEKIFKQFGLDAWFKPEKLHPRVESLIYWRDVKKSGIVFGSGLTILIAMSLFSLISVFAYVSLLVLFGTVSFRIYKNVLQAVQKTSEGHPFKEYLDFDLTLSQDKVQQLTTVAVAHFNALLSELRRLFLVEDLVDSIKFGVVLYCLTYVGAIFNGMTCVIIAFIALFTLPKVYENNKQSIDAYLELVRSKILEITEKVKAAVPIGKKTETDKEK